MCPPARAFTDDAFELTLKAPTTPQRSPHEAGAPTPPLALLLRLYLAARELRLRQQHAAKPPSRNTSNMGLPRRP